MNYQSVSVPMIGGAEAQVEVAFLVRGADPKPFEHIQRARNGTYEALNLLPDQTEGERIYIARAKQFAPTLASHLPTITFDAIVSPPSSFKHAEPFRAFLTDRARMDLTGRFHRSAPVRSGEGATVTEITSAMTYVRGGDESSIHSLLIVDESFHTGRTIAGILSHLRDAGLPEDCRVVLACAFWSVAGNEA